MNLLLVLPILIPLTTTAISLLLWRHPVWQRRLCILSSAALLAAGVALLDAVRRSGILAVQMGNWPAPFGISFVADLFSALMVTVAGLMGTTVAIYSAASVDWRRQSFGYYPLFQVLLMGVCGAFLTGDIFNLYVWFEVMLIASFVLMALGGERAQMEGSLKYVTLNLTSSALFLAAVGILYGLAGTLNMADLARKVPQINPPGLITTVAMLFLVAFGIKAAAFPLFFWLPASYHTPPVAVSAIFAGLLTKVGVYALIRVFTLIFVGEVGYTHTLILVLSGLTMVTGVLGAVAQNDFRRILSFHIVSQIGYMMMGLGLFTPLALAGSVFYIIHHIIVKTNLFLISGVAQCLNGSYDLKKMGGLYRAHPGFSILFLISALSLAGVPPLSGFFAKLALVQAGLEINQYAIVATALGVSLLTLFSMTKIWSEAFWKPSENGLALSADVTPIASGEDHSSIRTLLLPVTALAAITAAIGLAGQPLVDLAMQTAEQLMNPAGYIQAVLGDRL